MYWRKDCQIFGQTAIDWIGWLKVVISFPFAEKESVMMLRGKIQVTGIEILQKAARMGKGLLAVSIPAFGVAE
jgi:hypothetical protein